MVQNPEKQDYQEKMTEDKEDIAPRRSIQSILRDYALLFGIAAFIIIADQLTKQWVETNILMGDSWVPWEWLAPYARLVHWYNTGSAFGMFKGFGEVFKYLAVGVGILIIWYFPQVPREEWYLRIPMAMQFGGAMGNLIDRLTIGHVTDWISVGNFAVFNIADASISMGVAVLVFGVWWVEYYQKKEQKEIEEGVDLVESFSGDVSTEEEQGEA